MICFPQYRSCNLIGCLIEMSVLFLFRLLALLSSRPPVYLDRFMIRFLSQKSIVRTLYIKLAKCVVEKLAQLCALFPLPPPPPPPPVHPNKTITFVKKHSRHNIPHKTSNNTINVHVLMYYVHVHSELIWKT